MEFFELPTPIKITRASFHNTESLETSSSTKLDSGIKDDFSPDDFLYSHHQYQSLSDLQSQLLAIQAQLALEMSDVVNDDFHNFQTAVTLDADQNLKLGRVQRSIEEFRDEVNRVRESLGRELEHVEMLIGLKRKLVILEKKAERKSRELNCHDEKETWDQVKEKIREAKGEDRLDVLRNHYRKSLR